MSAIRVVEHDDALDVGGLGEPVHRLQPLVEAIASGRWRTRLARGTPRRPRFRVKKGSPQ